MNNGVDVGRAGWRLRVLAGATGLALVGGLPLLGVVICGQPLAAYLEFPPLTRYIRHPQFSWLVFLLLGSVAAGFFGPLCAGLLRRGLRPVEPPAQRRLVQPFPWWGWGGVGLTGVAWGIAWTRQPGLHLVQPHTFTPLWLGYILVVNGLCYRRTGRCLLHDQPGRWAALFAVSAAFWWIFEYLNRFVQNWYYLGIDDFSAGEYVLFATLAFATVLPAVLATTEWLASFPRLDAVCRGLPAWRAARPKRLAAVLLSLAVAGLTMVGVWPNLVFPLLWLAPLGILWPLAVFTGQDRWLGALSRGDWRPLLLPALAALMCGFFWEMWNAGSLAHWRYTIPYVHRFPVFEMPILGYLGYLPFGLECALAWEWILGLRCPAKRGESAAERGQ